MASVGGIGVLKGLRWVEWWIVVGDDLRLRCWHCVAEERGEAVSSGLLRWEHCVAS